MKRKLFLALMALATSFSLVSCGDDDKDDDNDGKAVYQVKCISCKKVDNENVSKINFTYDASGRLTKVTRTNNHNSNVYWNEFSYPSATSFIVKNNEGDEITCSVDAASNTLASIEENDGKQTFAYTNGYLTSVAYEDYDTEDPFNYTEIYKWENGNLTSIKTDYSDGDSDEYNITYSEIDNNINFEITELLLEENILFSTQFIKNISKNLPSVIGNDYRSIPLTTTLDEKGRPATIECNECVFTFEYFE